MVDAIDVADELIQRLEGVGFTGLRSQDDPTVYDDRALTALNTTMLIPFDTYQTWMGLMSLLGVPVPTDGTLPEPDAVTKALQNPEDVRGKVMERIVGMGFCISSDDAQATKDLVGALGHVEFVEKHKIHEPAKYAVELGVARMEGDTETWETSTWEVTDDLANPDPLYLKEKAWEQWTRANEQEQEPIEASGYWLHSYDVIDDTE